MNNKVLKIVDDIKQALHVCSSFDFDVSDDLEPYEISTLIDVLRYADDLYHNGNQPCFSDNEYDVLRAYVKNVEPENSYFLGVGSNVRGGKVKLPYTMGSLDQIEIGEIEQWIDRWNLHQHNIVATEKLDGVSALVIYDSNGQFQIAYSRGNGIEGADITRHLRYINIPKNINHSESLAIRGELIISKPNFEEYREQISSRYNRPYKNARNMIAGLMNAKENPNDVYSIVEFIAYDVIQSKNTKTEMLSFLQDLGLNIPQHSVFTGKEIDDALLAEHLQNTRVKTQYDIDGLVLDVDCKKKRKAMTPTRETLNPAYAVKYKVADASNQAEAVVRDIEWNVSKHGYLKPVIIIEPVNLVGVTITRCTGFNAKFIFDNKIQPGCKIRITRSGDVIPFCLGVTEPGPLQ